MLVTIGNGTLTVAIEDAGAQLASVRDAAGREYLWQGDPEIWPRRAPLLFPTVGRLKDGAYLLSGERYKIPTHGFCRSAPFAVTGRGEAWASFRFCDTEETRGAYPFSFALTVTYALEGKCIVKTHCVENRTDRPMPYELGGHDGWRIVPEEDGRMDECGIRFPGVDAVTPYGMDAQNMVTPKDKTFALRGGRMPLKPSAYGLDTIILDEFKERKAELLNRENRPVVSVAFDDFPYLGVWTAARDFDTNYVCIEPWTTLPDAVFAGRELTEKPGVRVLPPLGSETLRYTVAIHGGKEGGR